jgi:hypothetical protein
VLYQLHRERFGETSSSSQTTEVISDLVVATFLSGTSSLDLLSECRFCDRGSIPSRANIFCSLYLQADSGVHQHPTRREICGPVTRGKERPGLEAHHSRPASAEIEWELHFLTPQAPLWRLVASFSFYYSLCAEY